MFFNDITADKWKIVVFVIFQFIFWHDFFLLVLLFQIIIIIDKILVNCSYRSQFSCLFKIFKFSNLAQKVFFLFSLDFMFLLFDTHFISHLFQMLFHNLIASCSGFIIYFFAKSNNISWINELFILLVTYISDALELMMTSLWIWVCYMETLFGTWSYWPSSAFLHRWCPNRKLLFPAWIYHRPAEISACWAESWSLVVWDNSIFIKLPPINFTISCC